MDKLEANLEIYDNGFVVQALAGQWSLERPLKTRLNRFGYPYNPPGIEMAFTVQTFREHYGDGYEDLIRLWLSRQIERTLDPDTGLINRQMMRQRWCRIFESR
jgi:hypothetical protein